jgi:hypothetical protein
MSRIRSIHPGLFTDEAFMQATPNARLLLIGIWTEAWDDGVFEKKPLTLKAKIFPADNVDVGELLVELEGLGFFQTFKIAGKSFGAVRNFRKFQRPKKPNSSGLLPEEFRNYVALSHEDTEPVEYQFGTGGEKFPQMEDGGWREGWRGEEKTVSRPTTDENFSNFWNAYPRKISRGAAERAFQDAIATEAPAVILEKLKTYKFSEDPKFIPSPVNWLKDRRWEDDPAVTAPAKQEKDLRNIPDTQLSNNEYWRKRMQLRNL